MRFKGIKRDVYAQNWDEAFPIGDGTTGGLVFGNPLKEVIATNHEELFVPMPENSDSRPYNIKDSVPKVRELLHEGKYKEATDFFLHAAADDGAPYNTIIWTNPFEAAADLCIDIDGYEESQVTNYTNKLDFSNAQAEVDFDLAGQHLSRKAFVSRSRGILVLNIQKEGKPVSFGVNLRTKKDIIYVDSVSVNAEGECISLVSNHSEDESGYVSVARVITDGDSECKGNGIFVSNANNCLILYLITPWKKGSEAVKVRNIRTLMDINTDYESLFKEHAVIHEEYFERVKFSFSDSDEEYTNEQLRDMCSSDKLAPEFLERMADFGRYLEICSFGKLPPNLQGVWNGTVNPPWSADYTLDENIQMMMWQALPGGFNGFVRCYFDWLESYSEDFRKNAEAYYGARGLFAASRVSTGGIHVHFHELWPMFFWTAGAGWLSSLYEDYYEYTGDENMLLRGVNYWKEVVLFYEDFLTVDETGHYEFAPSYSPENTPLGHDSPTAINATMDVAIAKEVYTNLINACKLLEIEEENVAKWEKELAMLPEYKTNEDGALKEWLPDDCKDDYHHRHSSHLYPVFPGNEAKRDGNEDLFEACHKAAECRLLDGVDAISGWGLVHLANISARLRDANLWYLAINRIIQKFTLGNFFTGHNEHSLFQMDANLGITAAVYEMFVYSDMEHAELFPVWLPQFENMSVEGIRVKGKGKILKLSRDNDSFEVTFEYQGRNEYRLVCPEGFSFEDGDTEEVVYPGSVVTFKGYKR